MPQCRLQVAKQSNAARSMCLWVRALDVYGRMVKVVEPKRQALHHAEVALAQVEAKLAAKRSQLRSGGHHACMPPMWNAEGLHDAYRRRRILQASPSQQS